MDLKDSGSPRILKFHYEKLLYPFDVFKSGITINNDEEKSLLKEKGDSTTKPVDLMMTIPSEESADEMLKCKNKNEKNNLILILIF